MFASIASSSGTVKLRCPCPIASPLIICPIQAWPTSIPDALERAAAIFRALGEPGRLRILTLLAQRAMCVTELADSLVENVSTISQRLKLLRSKRLARSRREGKHIFYALADQHIADLVANAFDHANEPSKEVRREKRPSPKRIGKSQKPSR